MRSLTLVAIGAVLLTACSDSATPAAEEATTTSAAEVANATTTTVADGTTTTAPAAAASSTSTTTTTPDQESPVVGVGQIDSAHRTEDGALVVSVIGYEWRPGPCQGLYEARLTDRANAVVEVTGTVGPSPDGTCEDVGFQHVLTVIGAAGLEADSVVDAFDGSGIPIREGIDALRPPWFKNRAPLLSCGIDADYGDAAPNAASRTCFRDAYTSGSPAEIEVISYGDEAESAHRFFRIIDAERLEVLEEFRPPVDGDVTTGAPWAWTPYTCSAFVFLDEPGFDIDGRLILDNDGECSAAQP